MRQMEATEDALYEQALSSLRQLNQEVFLNDLETKLKQTIVTIQQEVDELKAKLEDDQLYLASTIQDLKQVVHSGSEQSTQQVNTLDVQVRTYFRDFYGHFTHELEQLKGELEESTISSKQLVENYVTDNESRLQLMQERVGSIEDLYARWLITLDEVKADMSEKARGIGHATEEQHRLLETVRTETGNQLSELERVIHMMQETYESAFETMKQELLRTIADVDASRGELDQSRLAWEQSRQDELTTRIESEVTLRQQLLDDVIAAQQAALQQLKEENATLMKQYEARDKGNRLFLIGLAVLGGVQIVLHFI